MQITTRHGRVARIIWEEGGRIDEAARRAGVRPETLRRWLADEEFRNLVAQSAFEPLLQATSTMLQWAPVAVARLVSDLQSQSATDARQAAREILKLALDTQRELARPPADDSRRQHDADDACLGDDPLSRRMTEISDSQLARILQILNEPPGQDA